MLKNKEMFYNEVRRNAIQMKEKSAGNDVIPELKKAALILTELSSTARKEGLFALEESAAGIEASELRVGGELKRMITLVVNGTDKEMLEDICLKNYYSRDYSGLNGYLYLIYLDTILEIQAGTYPVIFEENLKSYMPPEIIEEMDKQREERKKERIAASEERWKERFEMKRPVTEEGADYYIIRLVEFCIETLSNQELQRVMREIDNSDAALLLKAMRGSAQKKYHDNLSKRLAAVILDELECMGLVRIKDISDAARRIFKVILSFGKNQEIKVPAGLDRIFE